MYLTTLLEKLHRDLTLKEVVQQFYKNPAFPMLANTDDVRRAIYESLNLGYELVGGDGEVLRITSEDELALGSMDQTLRRARPKEGGGAAPSTGEKGTFPVTGEGGVGQPRIRDRAEYRVYRLDVPHRSIADAEARRTVANLLPSFSMPSIQTSVAMCS